MDCKMNACTSIFALTLVLTLTLLLSQTEGIQMKSTLYARKDNCRVDQSQESPLCVNGTCRGGRTACVVACSTHAQCTSVNIRSSDGLCMGVGNPLYGFRSKISTDTDWKNFSPDTRDVRDGDWILVFRAQSGVDSSWTDGKTLAAWNDDSISSDDDLDTLDRACHANTRGTCTDFYRSRWLKTWPSAEIDQVRLALFAGGEQKAEMVFDGQGSTRDGWFHSSRLVSSSWTDMLSTNASISLAGQMNGIRIFVATTTTDETNCDWVGWLVVMNKPGNKCLFDKESTGYSSAIQVPQFLYSPISQKINFNKDVSSSKRI